MIKTMTTNTTRMPANGQMERHRAHITQETKKNTETNGTQLSKT